MPLMMAGTTEKSDEKAALAAHLAALEAEMSAADFWADKPKAQATVREYERLKAELAGAGQYDGGNAVVTLLAGAGGDDAEDFAAMLFSMYRKFAERRGWPLGLLHQNQNDHGGFRNLTFLVRGRGAYGTLKSESGVHRLVRISPFNARQLRHTSFALVEVLPEFQKGAPVEIKPEELKVDFARSSGPGGQNVNKRETAVRLVHLPTGLAVHVESERSQERNRERALGILKAKLWERQAEERRAREAGMSVSKTTEIEWGNKICSYVLHPYKLVKDHRSGVETGDVEAVLDGNLEPFLKPKT